MKTPNIFDFATSELSQDAALCWLLSWASPEYTSHPSGLQNVGTALLKKIFLAANRPWVESIKSLKIKPQDGRADIICLINNQIALIIEDKVGTKAHGNQLENYKAHVRKKYGHPEENIICAYIQTGDQCEYKKVSDAGYVRILRKDLLEILETTTNTTSDILTGFTEKLRKKENKVQSYKTLPLEEWEENSWIGFYTELRELLGTGHWDKVPNPAGGFFGFWWGKHRMENCQVYLQLEKNDLCLKISVTEQKLRSTLRNDWYKKVVKNSSSHQLKFQRPDRFGHGQCMTFAVSEKDYRAAHTDGIIDLEGTIKNLQAAKAILEKCIENTTPTNSESSSKESQEPSLNAS